VSRTKFENYLKKSGLKLEIQTLPDSTKTAKDAAEAIGCELAQIAKSIVFKGKKTGKPYLAIVSGPNKADIKKLSQQVNEEVELATPDFVYETTGYRVGGVPPFGHKQDIETFTDPDLMKFDEVWAAAGDGNSVVRLEKEIISKLDLRDTLSEKRWVLPS
jgi:prolyl-tRNA editing enzyme YbaK/EbsC (Cys-tRNA(Pro) deacylase)